jgi:hypothetical protein
MVPHSTRIAVLAVVGLISSGCGPAATPSGMPSTARPSTAATAQPPAPTRSPAASAPSFEGSGATGLRWLDPAALGSRGSHPSVMGVAASPDGDWVAVGGFVDYLESEEAGLQFQARSGLAWTSTDGTSWVLADGAGALEKSQILGVTWTSAGWIAVGSWRDERLDSDGST